MNARNLGLMFVSMAFAAQEQMARMLEAMRRNPRKATARSYRINNRSYPFSNTRQESRSKLKYYMKRMPNGHEVMQTRSSKEIARLKEEA